MSIETLKKIRKFSGTVAFLLSAYLLYFQYIKKAPPYFLNPVQTGATLFLLVFFVVSTIIIRKNKKL
ncbi:hypothetical protein [Runella sp.]|uniref:hypothetical protein n=1 Tax=Runella sp. TaxID=1960881 RepID=UPI003D100615